MRIDSRFCEVSVEWVALVLLFFSPFIDIPVTKMLCFLNSALRLFNPSRILLGLCSAVRMPVCVDSVFGCVKKCIGFLRLLKNLGEYGKHAARNANAISMKTHISRMEK